MRSRGLTPIALSALATRLVLISNSVKLVWRPSNSKAMALPRLFARARSMSARFAGSPETDMFLPEDCFWLSQYWRRCAAKTIREWEGRPRVPDAVQRFLRCSAEPGPAAPQSRDLLVVK